MRSREISKADQQAVLKMLRSSPDFKVDPAAPDNPEKFQKQLVYYLLGLPCEEALFGGHFKEDGSPSYAGCNQAHKNLAEFFEKTISKGKVEKMKEFFVAGRFEQPLSEDAYFTALRRDIEEYIQYFNDKNNDGGRHYTDFQAAHADFCVMYPPAARRPVADEKKEDLPPEDEKTILPNKGIAKEARNFLSLLKDKDKKIIELSDNRFISYSNFSGQISADKVSALIYEHLGPGAVKMAHWGGQTVSVKEAEGVLKDPLQCHVHASGFDLPSPASADPAAAPASAPKVGFVAVDRYYEDVGHKTELWAVPSQLKDLEWDIYIKMAETHLINYIFSRPPNERDDPIFMWDIHPDMPPKLLAAMQFCMRQAERKDIQFVCAPALQDTIEKLVATVPPDFARPVAVDPLFEVNPPRPI